MTKRAVQYAIRARFVDGVRTNLESLADMNAIYLGHRGQWASREKALTFRTREAAERALQEKWNRLRNTGSKSVILSVVKA